jgi:hypothetical protein
MRPSIYVLVHKRDLYINQRCDFRISDKTLFVVQEEISSQIMVSRIDKPREFYPGMRMLDDRMYSPAADNVNMTRSRCKHERMVERKREQESVGSAYDRMIRGEHQASHPKQNKASRYSQKKLHIP